MTPPPVTRDPPYSQRHGYGDEERLGGRVLASSVDLLPVREGGAAALVTRLPRSALDAVHQPEVQLSGERVLETGETHSRSLLHAVPEVQLSGERVLETRSVLHTVPEVQLSGERVLETGRLTHGAYFTLCQKFSCRGSGC